MKRFTFFILALLVLNSCDKSEKTDYLIFGKFYGFCVGDDCVKMFKVTENNLYQENSPDYPSDEKYKGNFSSKVNDKLSIAKPLLSMIPAKLKDEETTIGCPDCADQGGVFVEFTAEGKTYFFRIDNFRNDVPVYLHEFLDEIDAVLKELN